MVIITCFAMVCATVCYVTHRCTNTSIETDRDVLNHRAAMAELETQREQKYLEASK
jgi:hypothetical protein